VASLEELLQEQLRLAEEDAGPIAEDGERVGADANPEN
jgi:hypothetical protein